jgi:hypothetical protein
MAGGLGAGTSGYTRVTERILRGTPEFVSKHEGVPKAWQGIAVRDLVGDRVLDELSVGSGLGRASGSSRAERRLRSSSGFEATSGRVSKGGGGNSSKGVSHELRTSRLTFAPAIATAICE